MSEKIKKKLYTNFFSLGAILVLILSSFAIITSFGATNQPAQSCSSTSLTITISGKQEVGETLTFTSSPTNSSCVSGAVTYSGLTGISGNTWTATAAGTYKVTASQPSSTQGEPDVVGDLTFTVCDHENPVIDINVSGGFGKASNSDYYVCKGDNLTYSVSLCTDFPLNEVKWFVNGQQVKAGVDTITLNHSTVGSYTVGVKAASSEEEVSVQALDDKPRKLTKGEFGRYTFDGATFGSKNISPNLGLTEIEVYGNEIVDLYCKSKTELELVTSLYVDITGFSYDSLLKENKYEVQGFKFETFIKYPQNKELVQAGETQHYQITHTFYSSLKDELTNYNSKTYTNIDSALSDYSDAIDEYDSHKETKENAHEELDKPGGEHPTLAEYIKHGTTPTDPKKKAKLDQVILDVTVGDIF